MVPLHPKVKEYLEKLDTEKQPRMAFQGEFSISQKIKEILEGDKDYVPTKTDDAERMSFDFLANYQNENSGWGTYYGPMFVLPHEGKMVEYPSPQKIDNEIIEYWAKRAGESKTPILKSRYADLVVDFSLKILNHAPDIQAIRYVIDSNIAISANLLADPLDCKTKIKRAINLSIRIGDQERLEKAKKVAIQLEKGMAVDSQPGLWGFTFRWFLLEFKGKVKLDAEEIKALLDGLEERLKRVQSDPWATQNAVTLLAEYYSNEKDEINLMRVLGVLENTFKSDTRMNSDALSKVHAYEEIHDAYIKYASRFPEAEKANKRISKEIGQLDLDWGKSLKEVSFEMKISQKEIDDFLDGIFGNPSEENIEKVIGRVAVVLLPKKDAIEKQLKDISQKHPMIYLATTQVIADDGIPIAKLSTLEEDYDNHFQKHALQYIQLGSFFVSISMDKLKKRFTKEMAIEFFDKASLFENENKEYLKRAISAYWDADYLSASHFLNPLIESALRELIKRCGGLVLYPNKLGGYDRVLLTALLRNDKIFETVYAKFGPNVLFYFKLVLAEKLGMNLRNDFAHGIGKAKFFGREASDRLFHVLILLSLVKKIEKSSIPVMH